MGVRLVQVGTQLADFAGWNSAFTNENLSNKQQAGQFNQNDDFYYYTWSNGGAAANCFQFAPIATPGAVTTPAFPVADDCSAVAASPDNDTVFIGTTSGADARVYMFKHSTGLFTNLNFPDAGNDDAIRVIRMHPSNSNLVLVGSNAAAAAGSGSLWEYNISGNSWTQLFNFGNSGGRQVLNFTFYGLEMFVGFGNSGALNLARCYHSDNVGYTAFTQVAGDSVNGSWATGTYRECFPFMLGSNLYCGLRGGTNGDAEVWRSQNFGQSWTKIGGDAINGGWTGKLLASRVYGFGNKLTVGLGTAAGDGEVWQWDESTELWTQIAGDSVNGTWAAKNTVGSVFVGADRTLLLGGGNSTANTSMLFSNPGGAFSPGSPGGFGDLTRRRGYPMGSFA
jgi:hypothetical protein